MTATITAPPRAAAPSAPKGTLIMGHHAAFFRDKIEFLERTARDHGDAVPLRLGPIRVFLLSDPTAIAEVLTTRATSFRKDLGLRRMKILLGSGLLTSEGAEHERRSRIAQPAFRPKAVETYATTMVEQTEAAVAAWAARGSVDLWAELSHLTLSIAAQTLFGDDVLSHAPGFSEAFTELLELMEDRKKVLIPIPLAIPTPANRRFKRARAVLDEAVYAMIRARRAAGPGEREDLLSRLLAPPADGGPGLTDEQLRDEVMTLVLAGHETTANALSFTFRLLAENPAVAARVRGEVDATLGGRPAGAADVARMHEVAATIQESMRLYPPAWIMGREATEAVELTGGVRIPRRAIAILSPLLVQRDPRWWPEPLAFRPERFAPDAPRPAPFTYFPFGGGKRACIGRSFALLEASLILATVLRGLDIEIDVTRPLELDAITTLRPQGGLPARVRRRTPAAAAPRSAAAISNG